MGADGSNGVIKPVSFTVGGTSMSITGLKWEVDSFVLTLSPHASLSGQRVEFIELDGTVGLSLEGSNAVEGPAVGTHTWSVASQPWNDGDLLILRISEASPPATPTPDLANAATVTLAPRTESFGTVTTVTVGWTDTMSCDFEYLVGLYDDQGNVSRDFGRHPAPGTRTVTVETSLRWDSIGISGLTVRVSCESLFGTGLRVVGEVSLASGLP